MPYVATAHPDAQAVSDGTSSPTAPLPGLMVGLLPRGAHRRPHFVAYVKMTADDYATLRR